MDPAVAQAIAFAAQFHQPPSPPQQPSHSAELYPTPATNLSPPIPSHPSYAEMIMAAISWENSQGKESGSSKRAIAKYIDRVYSNLPPTHSALLTHHLKRLKNAGQLVMVKNSYQLSSVAGNLPRSVEPKSPSAAPSLVDQSVTGMVSVTPKRKPGRPSKVQAESEPVFVPEPVSVASPGFDQVVENGSGSSLGKRRRGRPAKERNPAVEVAVPFESPVADVAVVGSGQVSKSKGRGRPAKVKALVNGEVAVGVGTPGRGRGRPKGVGMKVGGSNVTAVVAVEKKRGWPKGKKRGKSVLRGAGVGVVVGVGKRRGRKPKGVGVGVGLGVRMGGVMKKRGRKPKGVGVAVVERKVSNGKPRGRPKKNFALVKHTDGQGLVTANEELLKKLEDMQLKVKGAVDVLKPILASKSEPDLLTALQQLEELSTMNITAASTAIIESPLDTVPVDMVGPPESTSEPEPLVPSSAPSTAFDETQEMSMPSLFSENGTGIYV